MQFNIIFETSMSCPYITRIATLIRAVHPSWSLSAIKTAIMTTATMLDKSDKPIRVDPEGKKAKAFDYGSGFVDPTRVLDPSLIYDAYPTNYKAFLCSISYGEKSLRLVARDNNSCNQAFPTASSLNYPSITFLNLKDSFSVTRTEKNVGKAKSVYKAVVSNLLGINVTVVPKQLIFNSYGHKIKFTVNFKVAAPSKGYAFGFLTWRSGDAQVTSLLVFRAAPSPTGLMR